LNGLSESREALFRARIVAQLENKVGEDLFGRIDFDSMMGLPQAKNGVSVFVGSDLQEVTHAETKPDPSDVSVSILFHLKVPYLFSFHAKLKVAPNSFSGKRLNFLSVLRIN
tara:strand:- start:344 stop:679 length:336 start_codon:yes stop_codon:yes gene_type:complete